MADYTTGEHELVEKEWRNGWQYQHCSCGVWIGPFHSQDYADDAFALHQAGKDHLIGPLAERKEG